MKRLIALLLVFACTMLLSGCSDNSGTTHESRDKGNSSIQQEHQETATPIPAPSDAKDFEYEILSDNTATIIRYVGQGGAVVIPSELDGHRVVGIKYDVFARKDYITSVVIPEGVTSIGSKAFFYCLNMTEVVIPDSVREIGEYAFARCKSLTSISFPDHVEEMGESICANCTSLVRASLPKNRTSISRSLFYECESLSEIIIPDVVTVIGDEAFWGCKSLSEIKLPDHLKSINGNAFYRCKALANITIPESVTYIGEGAFAGCNNLVATVFRGSYAVKYFDEQNYLYGEGSYNYKYAD